MRCATLLFQIERAVETKRISELHIFVTGLELLNCLLDLTNNVRTVAFSNGSFWSCNAELKVIDMADQNYVCASIHYKVYLISVSTFVWVHHPGMTF